MPHRTLRHLYQQEFKGYSLATFRQDLFAGITVAAVALPLALAFGVASGATAAAGLVTAIVSGLIIGALSGAPYQISGPTGAMSAVLIALASQQGLQAVWLAGLMAGVLLVIVGVLRLGRFVALIPAPVIVGFTSGIALIIAIGQLDHLLGVRTPPSHSALVKLSYYFTTPFSVNLTALALGLGVALLMLLWPQRLAQIVPASLLALIAAGLANVTLGGAAATVHEIPTSLALDARLDISAVTWDQLRQLLLPALSIAALGAVESLLCGTVASSMTGVRLQANQELRAQGVGNILLPFLGGVPATAAIARTSVGIRAGGKTRMVSFVHSAVLLGSMYLFAPLMSQIPLSALAGVLLVTAWRMNEWEAIRFYVSRRFYSALLPFAATLLATVTLDLTEAIIIGTLIASALVLSQLARAYIVVREVDPARLPQRALPLTGSTEGVLVAYVSGPLFFAALSAFNEALQPATSARVLILSLRGVPLLDTSGARAIEELHRRLTTQGGTLLLSGLQPQVQRMLERSGVAAVIGAERIFWSADQAIIASTLQEESSEPGNDT